MYSMCDSLPANGLMPESESESESESASDSEMSGIGERVATRADQSRAEKRNGPSRLSKRANGGQERCRLRRPSRTSAV